MKFIDTFMYDGDLHNWYKIEKSDWLKNNKSNY